MDDQRHEMQLATTHASGAEEWFCPICGRRFVMRWDPFERVIIESGDESASHSGSKGGLRIGQAQVIEHQISTQELSTGVDSLPRSEGEIDEQTELPEALRPWLKGIKDAGLDDLLNEVA